MSMFEHDEDGVILSKDSAVGPRKIFRTSIGRYLDKLVARRQTPNGAEIPDATPMAPPIGYVKQPSMVEIIRQQIRSAQLAAEAEAAGHETFEEADDFDVGDEFEPISAYEFEEFFEPPADNRPAAKADSPEPAKPASEPASPAPSPAPSGGSDPSA